MRKIEWLDKVVKKHMEVKEMQNYKSDYREVIKNSYLDKVEELWGMFREFYDLAKDKFIVAKIFTARENEMYLVIGDIEIHGLTASMENKDGFYGVAKVNIKYLNSNQVGNVHFDYLLLGYVNGVPSWIYRDYVNDIVSDVIFTPKDVERVFKSAFSIYQ